MLNAGMVVTALGLLVPFFIYSFAAVLAGFALLGIGNTIVQVSANPLLVDVVPSDKTSSFLSFSQFVKVIGLMIGAPLAGYCFSRFGNWRAGISGLWDCFRFGLLWLASVTIEESRSDGVKASLSSSFKLFRKRIWLLMVLLQYSL